LAQSFFPITPVEVTPGTASAWTDVDVSAYVPAGATGVVLHIVNKNAGSGLSIGVRKNGSTDNRYDGIYQFNHEWAAVGIDANRILEAYVGSITDIDIWLVGYTTSGVTFFTNAYDKSLSTTSAWTDIDCSAVAPNAIGLIFEANGPGYGQGIRKNGSSDNRHLQPYSHIWYIIGCDASQIVEGWIDNAVIDFFLVGYITDGCVFNTNAPDVSLGTAGSWLDLTALPANSVMGFIEVYSNTVDSGYGLRKNGSAEDIFGDICYGTLRGIVECDASQIIEGKVESLSTDFFVLGYATSTSAQTLLPSSIVQAVAIGTPALTYPQTLSPSSIVQAVAYGTPKLILFIQPSSIVQAIAIGTPIVTQPQLYESYLEENNSRNVRGVYWRAQSFTPQSSHKITSVKIKLCRVGSPGAGAISIKATDGAGKPTGADLCSASIDGDSLPTSPTLLGFSLGAGTNLSAGTKYAIVWRLAGGDTENYVQTRYMYTGTYAGGAAIESSDSGVTWDVWTDWDFVFQDWGEALTQTVYPDSIVQLVAYGTPAVIRSGLIIPTSIVQQIIIGTPTVQGGIPGGFVLQPGSIVQQIIIGSPTILKYIWHVILDGQYAIDTPGVNRAYTIGRDASGNPVYGTAVDSTELALVGERLDFIPDPAIPTTAQAGDVASAVLSKMRLRGKGGVILIPPNCGQELFDVVQVSDSMANQSAVSFRVVGIRFEYNPKLARYAHKLILGAP